MKIVLEYIKYKLNTLGRTANPSPFISGIQEAWTSSQLNSKDAENLKALFRSLENDSRSIEIEDFGAGSKRLSNVRKVSDIFKTSSSKGKYGSFLYALCHNLKPNSVLEFGTSLGIGSAHMKLGYPNGHLTTVEACKNTQSIALENLSKLNIEDFSAENSTFNQFIEQLKDASFDLVFIDGHHDGKALSSYMIQLKPYTHDQTIFILDDIRWSNSMRKAWNDIIDSEGYHTTIDLFRMGIAIPNSSADKQHFTW